MLLVTEAGHMFTVVEDMNNPEMLFVRSQDKESIEDVANTLADRVGAVKPKIINMPDWDYQFRIHMDRDDWAWYLDVATHRIEAHKLKPAVARARGSKHPISKAVFDLFMYMSENRPDGSLPHWLKPLPK